MPDLSPAAQAVLDAWVAARRAQTRTAGRHQALAAALRAAADAKINPNDYEPACVFEKDYWDEGFSAAVETIREGILAIATELENLNG